jgi:hypothetical protein
MSAMDEKIIRAILKNEQERCTIDELLALVLSKEFLGG